jgi:hypothetical protein
MISNRYTKPILLIFLFIFLTMAACSPTGVPEVDVEQTPGELPPQAVLEAISQVSQELNVSVDEIEVLDFEEVDWPDACLGIPQEDQVCAQVITPGFRVVLEANGQQYEFRSNQDGTLVVQVPGE